MKYNPTTAQYLVFPCCSYIILNLVLFFLYYSYVSPNVKTTCNISGLKAEYSPCWTILFYSTVSVFSHLFCCVKINCCILWKLYFHVRNCLLAGVTDNSMSLTFSFLLIRETCDCPIYWVFLADMYYARCLKFVGWR